MNKQDIQNKMIDLVLKWKDKPEPKKYTADWFQRGFDRTTYKNYKRQLEKIENNTEEVKEDLYDVAVSLFSPDLASKNA